MITKLTKRDKELLKDFASKLFRIEYELPCGDNKRLLCKSCVYNYDCGYGAEFGCEEASEVEMYERFLKNGRCVRVKKLKK